MKYEQKKGVEVFCIVCNNSFMKRKSEVDRYPVSVCSNSCKSVYANKKVDVFCKHCNKQFQKQKFQLKKFENSFCNRSCAATYNNTHKTKGTRRSKLEIWIEKELSTIYPNIQILYSDKQTINSELDIYIPSIKLAFELNGIFHYEPIYGSEKLGQIKNNDNRKFQACLERQIEICVIDTSGQKRFTEHSSQKYLDIIVSIMNSKLNDWDKKDSNFRPAI